MGERVDAVVIGAGVIGAAVAFELSKRGYKTLNIDKLPASGYGPTSNSPTSPAHASEAGSRNRSSSPSGIPASASIRPSWPPPMHPTTVT